MGLLALGMVSLQIVLAAPTSSLVCSGSLQDLNIPASGLGWSRVAEVGNIFAREKMT